MAATTAVDRTMSFCAPLYRGPLTRAADVSDQRTLWPAVSPTQTVYKVRHFKLSAIGRWTFRKLIKFYLTTDSEN